MGSVFKGTCIICSIILAIPLVANIVLLIYGFNRYKCIRKSLTESVSYTKNPNRKA